MVSPTFSVNPKRRYRYTLVTLITLLATFILLGNYHETLTRFDIILMEYIWGLRNDKLSSTFGWITYIGSSYVTIPIFFLLAVHFLVNRSVFYAIILTFNFIGVRTFNGYLKSIYGRTRPDESPLLEVSGFSFPSGHAMNSTAFIGLIGYLLWRYLRSHGKRSGYVLVASWTIIFLIGLSRVYLGVHFPSDVLAGFAAGGAWLLLSMMLIYVDPERPNG